MASAIVIRRTGTCWRSCLINCFPVYEDWHVSMDLVSSCKFKARAHQTRWRHVDLSQETETRGNRYKLCDFPWAWRRTRLFISYGRRRLQKRPTSWKLLSQRSSCPRHFGSLPRDLQKPLARDIWVFRTTSDVCFRQVFPPDKEKKTRLWAYV